jgi:hypothetical protein
MTTDYLAALPSADLLNQIRNIKGSYYSQFAAQILTKIDSRRVGEEGAILSRIHLHPL